MDSTGVVQEHRQYDTFGQITSPASPTTDFPQAFTGRPLDTDTELYNYRARWYDPAVGRFVSEDPSGFGGGDANLYRYAGNSPVVFVDPSGLGAYAGSAGGTAQRDYTDLANWITSRSEASQAAPNYPIHPISCLTPPEYVDWEAAAARDRTYATFTQNASDLAGRGMGGLQVLGGFGETLLGATIATGGGATEGASFGATTPVSVPVMLVGGGLAVHGVSNMKAGLNRVITGVPERPVTSQFVDHITGDPATTDNLIFVGEMAAGGMAYSRVSQAHTVDSIIGDWKPSGATAVPSQLTAGQAYHAERLAALSTAENTAVWRPTMQQTESAAFRVIVGEPKFTPGGVPVGTIIDVTEGGLMEIKSGASVLNSSYQLRLQTFRSLKEGTPYTIETTRPRNATFQSYLENWGVTVRPPE